MHTKNLSTGLTDLGNDRVSSWGNSSYPVRKLQFSHRETGAVTAVLLEVVQFLT